MNSQDKIKALNIVFTNWINPSLQVKLNALKKLQRFCRRGSGAHAHYNMICNEATFGQMCGPPVLYRQKHDCHPGECERIPIRIFNKYVRMRYAIDKLFKNIYEIDNEEILNKHYTCMQYCYCNNKPLHCYEYMVHRPRGNFTAKDGIRYIMCELSGDELTYYTRFKLSNYLIHRLS